MKSKEFLFEEKKVSLLPLKIINTLHQYCSDFIANTKKPLYRGINADIPLLSKRPIRKNRCPRDTSYEITAAFNYIFEAHTGYPAIRNTSAFTTMDEAQAADYGALHLVFPINGTHYLYNSKYSDLFAEQDIFDSLSNFEYFLESKISNLERIDRILSEYEPIKNLIYKKCGAITKAQIDKFLNNSSELKKYWLKYTGFFGKFLNSYYIYDGFHPELNNSKGEIQLFGTNYFYMINQYKIIEKYRKTKTNSTPEIFIGKNDIDRSDFFENLTEYVFNAIKKKQEIYMILNR